MAYQPFLPRPKSLLGMVHVGGFPGTPRASQAIGDIVGRAQDDAASLAEAGFDGLIVENMHDVPYVHGRQGPEIVAGMTRSVLGVMEASPGLAVGVQVLSGGNHEALAIAQATGAGFIRCENFVFAHVADEGLLERAEAGPLLRYRKAIGAEQVSILADVKKKHASHALTSDVTLDEAVRAAAYFGADGVVVTGTATGLAADPEHVRAAALASELPVVVGSGVTTENVEAMLAHADAVIVGSSIKHDGHWTNAVDPERAKAFVERSRASHPGENPRP